MPSGTASARGTRPRPARRAGTRRSRARPSRRAASRPTTAIASTPINCNLQRRRSSAELREQRRPAVGEIDRRRDEHERRREQEQRAACTCPRLQRDHAADRGRQQQPAEHDRLGDLDDQVARRRGALPPLPLLGHVDVARDRRDFVAGEHRRRCAVHPAGAPRSSCRVKVNVQSVRAFCFAGFAEIFLHLRGVEPEALLDRGERPLRAPRPRRATRPRALLGHDVCRTFRISPDAATYTQPFFGAIRHVPFERRDAHAPARLRQIHAEQLAPVRARRRSRSRTGAARRCRRPGRPSRAISATASTPRFCSSCRAALSACVAA